MKKHTSIPVIFCMWLLLISIPPTSSSEGSLHGDLWVEAVRRQQRIDLWNENPARGPAGVYHTYDEMTALLWNLAENHSEIMSLTSIGKTYEGRDLWMVKLSDNVSQDEEEPGVLFMGAHHGDEKPSYEVCLYFLIYMVEHYDDNNTAEVRDAVDNNQIYIIPMVNPDGVEAGTRKNRSPNYGSFGLKKEVTSVGVDVNRNYGYKWLRFFLYLPFYMRSTSYVDSSVVYRGPYPFSENETQAIREFIDTHRILVCLSYHTFGKLVLYPWGFSRLPPKEKDLYVSLCENISSINQYVVAQSISLYPTIGDACDWMYGTYGVYCLTIELGDSYAPSEPEVVHEMCMIHTMVNLYVCHRAQYL